jgi:hypothetical protein
MALPDLARLVASSCGKTQYPTRKAARKAARDLRAYARRKGRGGSADEYRCGVCSGEVWHVTTGGRAGHGR